MKHADITALDALSRDNSDGSITVDAPLMTSFIK
jgi:hypothetical protein